MQRLMSLFNDNWDSTFKFPSETLAKADYFTKFLEDELGKSFSSHLIHEREYKGGAIGVSQLGKPAIRIAWDYFYGKDNSNTFEEMSRFLYGHLFEVEVLYYALRLGYKLIDYQPTVKIGSGIVPDGHPDIVLQCPDTGQCFVVECKFVDHATTYITYSKYGINNNAYLTQLNCYTNSLQMSGCWVIGSNKGPRMAIPYTLEQAQRDRKNHLDKAEWVAGIIKAMPDFGSCLQFFEMPKPNKRKDGTYWISADLLVKAGVPHPVCCLYDYKLANGKTYVTGYNYPTEYKHFEPKELE